MANDGRFNGDQDFDHKFFSVIEIILLALGILIFMLLFVIFCVTVYAICLKIRRSSGALRRRREMIRSHRLEFVSEPTSVRIQSRPLEESVIKGFPVFLYGSENREEGLECAVCLCEFEENEKGRTLPMCGHSFHVDCINMWFRSHSTCPLCRTAAAAAADPSPAVDCVVVIVAGETSGTTAEQVPIEAVEKQ